VSDLREMTTYAGYNSREDDYKKKQEPPSNFLL
jgi:hypothetical protein